VHAAGIQRWTLPIIVLHKRKRFPDASLYNGMDIHIHAQPVDSGKLLGWAHNAKLEMRASM